MPVHSRLFPRVLAVLLHVVAMFSFPVILIGAGQDELMDNAAAAIDDELFDVAEQYLKQYSSFLANPELLGTDYIVMLARTLHGQKRYPEMLALLRQNRTKAEKDTAFPEFLFWLAGACYANGEWDKAMEEINLFEIRFVNSGIMPDVTRLKAKILLKLVRNSEAIDILKELAGKSEKGAQLPDDQLALGQILASSGRVNEACSILEKLLVFPPDTSAGRKCRSILGRIYMDSKRWPEARRVYEPLASQNNIQDNFRLQAVVALSEIAVAQTNLNGALAVLDNGLRLMQNGPQKHELSLRKGMLLLKLNRIEEGTILVHNYVSAFATNAVGARVQLELAQSMLANGLNENALVEYQNFLESFGAQADLAEAYHGKGSALFNLGRYHEAAAAFKKAGDSTRKPQDKTQYNYRAADALFAGGQFGTAGEIYDQISAGGSGESMARMALFQAAECRLQDGDRPGAELILWRVYDEDPSDELSARALLRLADILFQKNALHAAETIYIWINQDYAGRWRARTTYGMGLVAYRQGNFEKALERFESTLALAKDDEEVSASAAYMSGWACFMLNRLDDARRCFAGVVASHGNSSRAPEAVFWLGEQDYNAGRYNSAENAFRKLSELYPGSSLADAAIFWGGRSAIMQNEFRRARDWFASLIKRYPSSRLRPEARYFQGVALCELGQFDAAILIFNEIVKQYPESDLVESAAFKKADCQFVLGSDEIRRYEEAIISYQAILDHPEYSPTSRLQAKYKIGRCLEKLNRTDEALAQYLQVVYSFLQNQDGSQAANLWFVRAAFIASEILEGKQHWRKAANIYEKVVEADVPASKDAEKRIAKLRAEHWLFFY